jgi:hypothetical protein
MKKKKKLLRELMHTSKREGDIKVQYPGRSLTGKLVFGFWDKGKFIQLKRYDDRKSTKTSGYYLLSNEIQGPIQIPLRAVDNQESNFTGEIILYNFS